MAVTITDDNVSNKPMANTDTANLERNKYRHSSLATIMIFAKGVVEDEFSLTLRLVGQMPRVLVRFQSARLAGPKIPQQVRHRATSRYDLLLGRHRIRRG